MRNEPKFTADRAQLLLWWLIWGAALGWMLLLYFFLGRRTAEPTAQTKLFDLIGLVPLFVSIIMRWLVLPRLDGAKKALPVFIAGLALAEGCGLLGIFLGGPYRDDLFVLGVLGVVQFMPLFVRKPQAPGGPGLRPS